METRADQVVRGSALRALRKVGGGAAVAAVVLALALWFFVNASAATKVTVWIALIAFAMIVTLCASIASASAAAQVQNGRLNFSFCGIRTRSIPLNAITTFELRTRGRLRLLIITSGTSTYVPNGALDRDELIALLSANGVAERNAA